MAVTFYSSLDAGAPGLIGSTFYANLRIILRACLVDGYGGKPPAGWVIGHDVTNGFSLGNGDGFINFINNGGNGFDVYLMEAITDGSAALAVGLNRRSLLWTDGLSTTDRHRVFWWTNTLANMHWSVVADDKTVIFHISSQSGTANLATDSYARSLYFGKYINASGLEGASTFCAIGGNGTTVGQTGFGNNAHGTVLRSPFDGLSAAPPAVGARGARFRLDGVISNLTPLVPSRLFPVRAALVSAAGVLGGYLRGVITEPALCSTLLSAVAPLLGGSDTWQQRVTPLVFPDGKSYLPLFVTTAVPAFFVGLDPEYWE